tara:strand:- start:155 stop:658 length:504 start_codon:yes stop_codon:yes gene_type:complete
MVELERQLMVIAINEGQFERISFLSSDDFTDSYSKSLYTTIEERSGDVMSTYLHLTLNSLESFIWLQSQMINGTIFCNLERIAILILEKRFKKEFAKLLDKLVVATDSDIERSLIEEFQLELDQDVFVLGDSFLEYLGHHASSHTKSRVQDYLTWRDGRSEQIKSKT